MFKKLLKIFTIEERLTSSLQLSLNGASQHLIGRLALFEKRIADNANHHDKVRSELNARLSRLEVLFAQELEAKEKARDELVKEKRLKK